MAVWALDKEPVPGSVIAQGIPEASRLGTNNPSYRANLLLPEGKTSRVAVLNTDDGLLVQDLPFELTLKQFRIDFYSTGMPKLFASDVQVFDPETNESFETTIEVNKPLIYKGVTVYQSSFDDGGTQVELKGIPLAGAADHLFDVQAQVGGSVDLDEQAQPLRLEVTGFKAINVESLPTRGEVEMADLALGDQDGLVPFKTNLASVTGPGVKKDKTQEFRNIGPSVTYKLRDQAGQAREFHNYMLPIDLDGGRYYLAGVRDTPAESFKYLRLPVDENGQLDGFMRLRAALEDKGLRREAAVNFAKSAFGDRPTSAELVGPLSDSAEKALSTFAGEFTESKGL
ncbi:MAG: cytochrome c biogenesis protein ResB, partial [Limnobacter sp.]|nr:cytochrome c biogenesis protein ResB [Limnobacter sp.]